MVSMSSLMFLLLLTKKPYLSGLHGLLPLLQEVLHIMQYSLLKNNDLLDTEHSNLYIKHSTSSRMNVKEISHILLAILALAGTYSIYVTFQGKSAVIPTIVLFAGITIAVSVIGKKVTAHVLDLDVTHEVWFWHRYGLKQHWYLRSGIPLGFLAPLFLSLISLGILKLTPILTYEATPAKHRAAKRFGFYAYSQLTDWHNALLAAGGFLALFALSIIAYFVDYQLLATMAAYHALSNMIPLSKLDGAQLFFGSRILYTVILIIAVIFFGYALLF